MIIICDAGTAERIWRSSGRWKMGGGMRAYSISALILRRAHLAQETLAFPKQGKRRLPETGDGRSAISADRAYVYARMRVRMSAW